MSKLRVGFDLGCLIPGSSGGLTSVIAGVLDELFARTTDLEFVVFCQERSLRLLRTEAANVEVFTLPTDGFYPALERREAPGWAIDVLFRGYPTLERISFPSERQIVLMPDLFHEVRPDLFDPQVLENRRDAFQQSFAGAGAIATISEYSRSMIERRLQGRVCDVFVMYPSLPSDFSDSDSGEMTVEERALVPDGDFFLYPANLWPNKNHDRLLDAAGRFRKRSGRSIEVILTGELGGWDELLDRHRDVPARHLGFVRTPLLRALYDRATALTFFSLHEGFGIPVLEAFEAGTPVLCSNVTSLSEVAGDAALMADPTDIGAMADRMVEIAGNAGLRELLVRRGKERLEKFSWSASAEVLRAVIERLADRSQVTPR